jgi:hypothetical protein
MVEGGDNLTEKKRKEAKDVALEEAPTIKKLKSQEK